MVSTESHYTDGIFRVNNDDQYIILDNFAWVIQSVTHTALREVHLDSTKSQEHVIIVSHSKNIRIGICDKICVGRLSQAPSVT